MLRKSVLDRSLWFWFVHMDCAVGVKDHLPSWPMDLASDLGGQPYTQDSMEVDK